MTQDNPIAHQAERDQIVAYLSRVPQKYHTGNYLIAYYASFAEVFTPDMLYQLWLNFQTYYDPTTHTHPSIDMVAIADLLQSNLCTKIGYELYEMNPAIAVYFQALSPEEVNHKRHIVLPPSTPTDVTCFVLEYAKRYYKDARHRHLYSRYSIKLGLRVAPEETLAELKSLLRHTGNAPADARRHLRILIDTIATQQPTAPQDAPQAPQLSHHRQVNSLDLTPLLEGDQDLWLELEDLLNSQLEAKLGEKWELADKVRGLMDEGDISAAFDLLYASDKILAKDLSAIDLLKGQFAAGQLSNPKYIQYKLQNILLGTEGYDEQMARAIERKELSANTLLDLINESAISQVINVLDYMSLSNFFKGEIIKGYETIKESFLGSRSFINEEQLKIFIIFVISSFGEVQQVAPRPRDLDEVKKLIDQAKIFEALMLLTSFKNSMKGGAREFLRQLKVESLYYFNTSYHENVQVFLDELKESLQDNLSAQDLIQQALESQTTSLDLSNQGIERLEDIPELARCVHLQVLNLSGNAIQDIEALDALRNLEELDLGENAIQDVNPVRQLSKLKVLSLNGNYITEIDKDFLKDLPALQQLFLAGNSIKNIPNEVFEVEGNCLPTFREYVSQNQITFGDTPTDALKIIEEVNEKKLGTIDLGYLELVKIPDELYELTHIKRVILGSHRSNNRGIQNKVSTIASKIANLIHLEALYLSDNYIEDLPKGMLSLKKLRILGMSRNLLLQVPEVVYSITSLERLYLSGNPIQSIPFRMLKLKKLERLGLNGVELIGFPKEVGELENCWEIVQAQLQTELFSKYFIGVFEDQIREQYEAIVRYRSLKNEAASLGQRAKYQDEIELSLQNINEIRQDFLSRASNSKRVSSIYDKGEVPKLLDKLISKIEKELGQNTQIPLIFLAFANHQQDLNLAKESEGIQQTLALLEAKGLVRCIVRDNITVEAYLDVLEQYKGQITIFHFAGHANKEKLRFEDKGVRIERILKQLVDNNPDSLELVFLNADVSVQNAKNLFDLGVDAVIAPQKLINDEMASNFATYFYQHLAKGEYIKDAFDRAYLSLSLDGSRSLRSFSAKDSFSWGLFTKEGQVSDYRIVHPSLIQAYEPIVNTAAVIFTAFSNPQGDLAHLREEQNSIQDSLFPLERRGDIAKHLIRIDLDLKAYSEFIRAWANQISIFHYGGSLDSKGFRLADKTNFFEPLMKELVSKNPDSLKLIFLNGCGTPEHVQTLLDLGVKVIISAQGVVGDSLAANFAIRFYQQMAKGASIREAFEQATVYIQLELGVEPPHVLEYNDAKTLQYRIVN